MKKIMIWMILLVTVKSDAQPHSEIMKCYYTGSGKIIKLRDGNLMSISNQNDTHGMFTSTPGYGKQDFFLLKLDSNYNIIWKKRYGGTGEDIAFDGVELEDSSLLIIGQLSDTLGGGLITNRLGSEDGWLIKVDKNGNFLWGKTLGTSDGEIFTNICDAGTNEFIVSGATFGNDGQFTGHHGGVGTELDWAICRIDSGGNILWAKQIGGTQNELGDIYVKPVGDGTFMIAAVTNSSDFDCIETDGLFTSSGANAQWIARMNGDGTFKWKKRIGSMSAIYGNRLVNPLYQNGLFTIPCQIQYNNESVSCSSFSLGSEAVWVVQFDTSGILKWQTCISGTKSDLPNDICPWYNGYAVGVTAQSNDGDFDINYGSWDAVVFFLDSVGNKLGHITPYSHPPNNQDEHANSILNYKNKILFTFTSPSDSTCKELAVASYEYTFSEISFWPVGVAEILKPLKNFNAGLYPNPTDGEFMIELEAFDLVNPTYLTIYDLNGRVLKKIRLHKAKTQVRLSNLSKGIYIANVTNGYHQKNIKLIMY